MNLTYKAYNSLGKTVAGTIESTDIVTATDILHRKGLYVSQINELQKINSKKSVKIFEGLWKGKKLKNLTVFMRQLYVLISSGTQVADALAALERQADNSQWRSVINHIRKKVEEGMSLSEAMELHPEYFDTVCCSLTAAGESSGTLPRMLDRLGKLIQSQLKIRNTVTGALIYPSLLIIVSIAIFSMLLVFVIPRFAMLFKTLDVPLPLTTEILVSISMLFRSYWWVVVLLFIAEVIGTIMFLKTTKGKAFKDTLLLKFPYTGKITKSLATARIIRILGVLLSGHVPILSALELTGKSTTNSHYTKLVAKALDDVERGKPISRAFSDYKLISPSVHEAIRSGEESGQLDNLLLDIANFLDEENEVVVRSLTSIIEPLILIFMGIIVGIIAVSMFLPLFDLTSMTQGSR